MEYSDERIREYLKALIQNIESSKRYILLYISFDLGLLLFMSTNIIFVDAFNNFRIWEKYFIICSILLLIISVAFLSNWLARLHVLNIQAVDWLLDLNVIEARQIHYPGEEYYMKYGWIYILGIATMAVGVFLVSINIIIRLIA